MLKRRLLKKNQKVQIIYDSEIGFVCESATFREYKNIKVKDVNHNIPVFKYQDKEINGTQCFWIPEGVGPEEVERIQKKLIPLQMRVIEAAHQLGYDIPNKIKDTEIRKMAEENIDKVDVMIKKFGFDPRDDSWIEAELAQTPRERNWFRFERENALIFSDNWGDIIDIFNRQSGDKVSLDEAKALSKKRMRYLLGAFNTRMAGIKDRKKWVSESREFEIEQREREIRMKSWSEAHKNNFPVVRTKKPVHFFFGPYFNECLENFPNVFTDTECKQIKTGVLLRVVSYDIEMKFIRLDFTTEMREVITGEENDQPWLKEKSDYDIWLKPEEIDTHLDILESLD